MAKADESGRPIVEFLRSRDYVLVKELGAGSTGKTVLLHDPTIDQHFVCKKYSPYSESEREALFQSFVGEIKLLHLIQHENVVRLFNYFLYPHLFAGYILLEYVDGQEIDRYARTNPQKIGDLFVQAVAGFTHLEAAGVLHRDIRMTNLMVRNDGRLKIIDLGFGKRAMTSGAFQKSITLNWEFSVPDEFAQGQYDFGTEVYFVGKLFERLAELSPNTKFPHLAVLSEMCNRDPLRRPKRFSDVDKTLRAASMADPSFSLEDRMIYQQFSAAVSDLISKISNGADYVEDLSTIRERLDRAYRSIMLEDVVPDASIILNCFIQGAYYKRTKGLSVVVVRNFVQLLRNLDDSRAELVIMNLYATLNSKPRYPAEDDIPF